MTNVTGEYDVIVELSVGILNAVLGAVHENQDPNYPRLPHSSRLFVDDRYRGPSDPVPQSERTGIVLQAEIQMSTPMVSLPADTLVVRPEVFDPSGGVLSGPFTSEAARPPGLASRLDTRISVPGGSRVPGICDPPHAGASQRVASRTRIRAWLRNTDDRLPMFVHGDLFVTWSLVRSDLPGVGTFVTLDRTNGPVVGFQPAPGTAMSEEQRELVARVVRNTIRGAEEPENFPIEVGGQVRQVDFKMEPAARRPSVLLLLLLTSRELGPWARDSVQAGLLRDGEDFGVGVGRDFLAPMLRHELLQGVRSEYSFSKWGVSAKVRPDVAGASFRFEPGRIVFSINGDGNISWWGADDEFTFMISQAFTVQVVDGGLEPVPDGDPVVDIDDLAFGTGYVEGKVRSTIRTQRDTALAAGRGRIREALDVGRHLTLMIARLNPRPAGVTLSGADVRPDGIVVHGKVGLAASDPILIAQVGRDGYFDALESWIPGGTIDRFVWEPFGWQAPSPRADEHRFVTEGWTVVSIFHGFWLRVEGTRVTAGGAVVPVSRAVCFENSPVVVQVDGVSGQATRPLATLAQIHRGLLWAVGHFDPWAPGRAPSKGHANMLLYFASSGLEEAAELLGKALAARRNREAAVLPVAVVPPGAFHGAIEPQVSGLLLAEDVEGRWAQSFGVSASPAAVLVSRRGAVVWREEANVTVRKLVNAMEKHAEGGGELAGTPIRLAFRLGHRPPEVTFKLAEGGELSLRRLRGRPVVVNFWTSRSQPSLNQLLFLRGLHEQRGPQAPVTIAIGDGESPEQAAEVTKELGLPFSVIGDPDRRIARAFGVWCWPATIWIGCDLLVEAIDFGAMTVPTTLPTSPGPCEPSPCSTPQPGPLLA